MCWNKLWWNSVAILEHRQNVDQISGRLNVLVRGRSGGDRRRLAELFPHLLNTSRLMTEDCGTTLGPLFESG